MQAVLHPFPELTKYTSVGFVRKRKKGVYFSHANFGENFDEIFSVIREAFSDAHHVKFKAKRGRKVSRIATTQRFYCTHPACHFSVQVSLANHTNDGNHRLKISAFSQHNHALTLQIMQKAKISQRTHQRVVEMLLCNPSIRAYEVVRHLRKEVATIGEEVIEMPNTQSEEHLLNTPSMTSIVREHHIPNPTSPGPTFNDSQLPFVNPSSLLQPPLYNPTSEQVATKKAIAFYSRRHVPLERDVERIRYSLRRNKFGLGSKESQNQRLVELCKELEAQGTIIELNPTSTRLCLAIATPMMARALRIEGVSSHIFIDGSSSLDSQNLHVHVLIGDLTISTVPVGILITETKDSVEIKRALTQFQRLVNHRLQLDFQPALFTSDDADEYHVALQSVFPTASYLLCHYHLLFSVWKYLWTQNVPAIVRKPIYSKFRQALYEKERVEFKKCWKELNSYFRPSNHGSRTPLRSELWKHLLKRYFELLYARRQRWAQSYFSSPFVRSNTTNNFSESTFLLLKDKVFSRRRSVNIIELVQKLVELDDAFTDRFVKLIRGEQCISPKRQQIMLQAIEGAKKMIADSQNQSGAPLVTQVSSCYYVQSSSQDRKYLVDLTLGCCECKVGRDGTLCKHQVVLSDQTKQPLASNAPVLSESMIKTLMFLVHGENALHIGSSFFDRSCVLSTRSPQITDEQTVLGSNPPSQRPHVEVSVDENPTSETPLVEVTSEFESLISSLQKRSSQEFQKAFLRLVTPACVKLIQSNLTDSQVTSHLYDMISESAYVPKSFQRKRTIRALTKNSLSGRMRGQNRKSSKGNRHRLQQAVLEMTRPSSMIGNQRPMFYSTTIQVR